MNLSTILAAHKAWVDDPSTGVRLTTPALYSVMDEVRANGFVGANLTRADLTRSDLYRANLVDANLSEANLSEANLSEANLSQASCCSTHLQGADLTDASLPATTFTRANLYRANLTRTSLRGADLTGAYLSRADLTGAHLCYAGLEGANLSGANLTCARLPKTDLRHVDFDRAILTHARLPEPTMVLLAWWGLLSPVLCSKAMMFDADAHHSGVEAFTEWANNGPCPYQGTKYDRSCNFIEHRKDWDPSTPSPRAFDLMVSLIREKCADSDYHDKAS